MKEDLEFMLWQRKYTKAIEGTGKIFFNDEIFTEEGLWEMYKKLKVTEVEVRGYDMFFTIELRRKDFMGLPEVIEYVAKEIVDTAIVIAITHKGYLLGRDLKVPNPAYKK
jgi:hypothetical protein